MGAGSRIKSFFYIVVVLVSVILGLAFFLVNKKMDKKVHRYKIILLCLCIMWVITAWSFWSYEFGNYNAIRTREPSNYADVFAVPDGLQVPSIVRDILDGASAEKRLQILRAKTTLITYAAGCCRFATSRLCDTAVGVGKMDRCIITSQDAIPQDFRKAHNDVMGQSRGGGYWAWKPYVILKHLNEMDDGDYLIYMDSGAYVVSPLYPLLLMLEATDAISDLGVLVFFQDHLQKYYCTRSAFVLQNCDRKECHDAHQVLGSFIIAKKTKKAVALMETWLNESLIYPIIADDGNKFGNYTNLPEFVDHRHDQAVITNIFSREKLPKETRFIPKPLDNGRYDALWMIVHDRFPL